MQNIIRRIHTILATIIGVGVWVQMFLAGIWHAEVVSTPEAHVVFGLVLLVLSLLTLILAVVGRMGRRVIATSGLLFILILLQPVLIEQRRAGIAFLSAFHTLNAAFVGITAGVVVKASREVDKDLTDEPVLVSQSVPTTSGD